MAQTTGNRLYPHLRLGVAFVCLSTRVHMTVPSMARNKWEEDTGRTALMICPMTRQNNCGSGPTEPWQNNGGRPTEPLAPTPDNGHLPPVLQAQALTLGRHGPITRSWTSGLA